MARNRLGLKSKISAEANASYSGGTAATADGASGNESPTNGKSIPIITGGARPRGELIWCQTRLEKNNECRGDLAICFGRNPFNRPLSLRAIAINGIDIYSRKATGNVNPAGVVRFYDGTQTAADPLIVQVEGATNTPAWTGYVYAVIEDVLLGGGDVEYHAEFGDDSTIDSSGSSAICDPALADIDLVYDARSGRYYGLTAPNSGASSIVISDGCRILSKVPIYGPCNADYADGASANNIFYCDNIFPLPCADRVVITGFAYSGEGEGWEAKVPGSPVSYSPVYNPHNGKPIFGGPTQFPPADISPNFPKNGLGPAEWDGVGSGIKWEVAYPLPGSNTRFAYLRRFDPTDCFALSHAWLSVYDPTASQTNPTLAGGNIACHIVDIQSGKIDYWYQDVGRMRTDYDRSGMRPKLDDWNVRDLPNVDEFLWCKTDTTSAKIAGLVRSTGSFTVYIIEHSSSGAGVSSTAAVTLPTTSWAAQDMNYDAARQRILVSAHDTADTLASGRIYKIGLDGVVSFSVMGSGYSRVVASPAGIPSDGKIPVSNQDKSKIGVYDVDTGITTDIYTGDAPTSDPIVDLTRDYVSIPTVTGRTSYAVSQVTLNDVPLSDVITDICALKGYAPEDLVFEGFTGLLVRGMTISSTTKVSDLLNRLGQLYGFVFAETDGKLKFRNRRSEDGSITPDWTLTDADLVEAAENITVQRQAATSVLGSLSLTWLDPDRDYESNNVMARRIVGVLSGEAGTRDEEISLPFAIGAESARRMLFRSFYAQAEGETRVGFSVGPKYFQIEPGDLVEITAGGATRIVQVRSVTHNAEANLLDIEADTFMAQATPDIGGAGGNVPPPLDGNIAGAYVHLDIPLISAPDYPGAGNALQYHGITTFDAASWGGADFYRSSDGTNFTKILEYDVAPMAVALATTTLGDSPQTYAMDAGATLTITVEAGDPGAFATVSYDEMMANRTLCAYGRAGAWELIAFQTVTDNLDGTLTLSNIERGLYGTQQVYFAGGLGKVHEAGDYVCLLDPALIRSTVRAASEIGREDTYAVVTADVDIFAAEKPRHIMTGVSLRPPPVANIVAEHLAGSDDLVITWNTTSPIPHTWEDSGASVTPPEVYTYTITVYDLATLDIYFTATTTADHYTWTGYGAAFGASSLVTDMVWKVTVKVTSPTWGDSFTTAAYIIRET